MNKIRELREQRGWTQAQLAQKLGVVQQLISRWESAEPEQIELWRDLAKVFGVTMEDLLK